MKVLLTGATGFIGSHLLNSLLANNYEVIILKRKSSNLWRIKEILEHCKCYDIEDGSLEDVFRDNQFETIIHLATYYVKHHRYEDIEKLIDSNIKFPSLLLELALKYNIKNFINTGTFFEYDLSISPINENSPLKPLNFYAVTKLAFEEILKQAILSGKIKGATLKIFTPYGPKDDENKLIPYLITNLLKGKEVTIGNPGQELRAIHVEDIVEAYLKVLNLNLGNRHEVYNIHGDSISIQEITNNIRTWIDSGKVNLGMTHPTLLDADNSYTRRTLQWNPTISFENGIKRTIEFYRGN